MGTPTVSLFKGIKPAGATHEWFNQNGSWRGWLKVGDWVYCHDDRYGWITVAKHPSSIPGKVVPL
jgi:hypothetical protein